MVIPSCARYIVQGFVVFVLLVAVSFLTIFVANLIYKAKAQNLLNDIQTLRVGVSTTADVQRVMKQHGGSRSQASASFCMPMDGAYSVWTGSRTVNWLASSVPVLKRLGLRQWGTSATVILRGDLVCYLDYAVGMEDPKGEWEWRVELKLVPSGEEVRYEGQHSAYRVATRDYKGGRSLRCQLTPDATEEQRRRAFSLDFSCVTNLGGCRQRCEIAPLLWRDVYLMTAEAGWTMPAEETKDPSCARLEQSH
jgi:hypothetical protein